MFHHEVVKWKDFGLWAILIWANAWPLAAVDCLRVFLKLPDAPASPRYRPAVAHTFSLRLRRLNSPPICPSRRASAIGGGRCGVDFIQNGSCHRSKALAGHRMEFSQDLDCLTRQRNDMPECRSWRWCSATRQPPGRYPTLGMAQLPRPYEDQGSQPQGATHDQRPLVTFQHSVTWTHLLQLGQGGEAGSLGR